VTGIITRYPRESVGVLVAAGAFSIICANALFMQNGPHPAPIFAPKAVVAPAAVMAPPRVQAAPVIAPLVAPRVETPARPRAQIVGDIQRELSRRGFYDGAVDGIWGAQTDAAARDFAQANALKITIEAGEDLLHAITASSVKTAAKPASAPQPAHNDPIAQLLAPGKRVIATQRILAAYGYGQIKPTGVLDAQTQDAIRKFESGHKMPVTGQISDQLIRALSEMSGQPID
jgi:peptidoglycan hydrolase-like protein with peptidoglycan-binding domain